MAKKNEPMEFRFLVQEGEDGQFEAYCIDAGAVGVGRTIIASIADMINALEAMYEACKDGAATMYAEPTRADLTSFSRMLAGAANVPKRVVAAGLVARQARKQRGKLVHAGFDATNLHVRRAA